MAVDPIFNKQAFDVGQGSEYPVKQVANSIIIFVQKVIVMEFIDEGITSASISHKYVWSYAVDIFSAQGWVSGHLWWLFSWCNFWGLCD